MCNKEKFWPVLCDMVDRPEWGRDPKYITFKERLEKRAEITEMLDEALSEKTTDEWLKLFAGKVPSAPILDIQQALQNPFVTQNGKIQDLVHQTGNPFRLVAPPIKCPGDPAPANPAPELGQHTDKLLLEIGLEAVEVEQLRALGVI